MKILIFGTGKIYHQYKEKINKSCKIIGLIDNDSKKQHTVIDGMKVYSPAEIKEIYYDKILLMSAYAEDMREQLILAGVDESRIIDYQEAYQFINFSVDKFYGKEICYEKSYTVVFSHSLTCTGAQNALYYLVKELINKGNSIVLVSLDDGIQREWYEKLNVQIIITENMTKGNQRLSKLVSNADKIIVNTLWMYRAVKYGIDYRRVVYWWIHETGELKNISKRTFIRLANNTNCNILSASHLIDQNIKSLYGEDIRVLRLFFCIEDYPSILKIKRPTKKEKTVFACIGGISYIKGQDLFLEAIDRLSNSARKKAKFLIIGAGELSEKEKFIVDKYEDIEFWGEINNQRMPEIYGSIDAIVCCSRKESMSIVVAEACMNSIPSIISDAAGIAKLVKHECNSLIFECENIEMLSSQIEWIIDNYSEALIMGIRARKIYEDYFTVEKFRERISQLGL